MGVDRRRVAEGQGPVMVPRGKVDDLGLDVIGGPVGDGFDVNRRGRAPVNLQAVTEPEGMRGAGERSRRGRCPLDPLSAGPAVPVT